MRNVVDVFNENLFAETSSDLLTIDTKIIMSDDVIQTIKTAEETGKDQYKTFVDEHMIKMTKPFHDTEQYKESNIQIKCKDLLLQEWN